jgi:hypothetical protein
LVTAPDAAMDNCNASLTQPTKQTNKENKIKNARGSKINDVLIKENQRIAPVGVETHLKASLGFMGTGGTAEVEFDVSGARVFVGVVAG